MLHQQIEQISATQRTLLLDQDVQPVIKEVVADPIWTIIPTKWIRTTANMEAAASDVFQPSR